ncbi:unnamed protein product [Victoria cruziana]
MVGLRDVFLFHSSSDPQASSLFPVLAPSLPQPSPSLAPPPPPPPAPPQQQPQSLLHSLPQHQLAHVMANDSNNDDDERRRVSEFQLWHHHHQRAVAGIPTMEAALGTGSSGGTTCQDCGNQAKKDCSHRRCRTCCKSRGFECPTHVKSTWVPAARRRERQHLLHSSATATTNTGKKPRLASSQAAASLTSNSATTPSRSFDTGSSHQEMEMGGSGLPGHVTAPAVFKCVRVTSIEDGDDEYAYQAAVKIGGRVFKGFLYDQGQDDSSSSSLPNLSELHLGDFSGGGGGSGKNANASSLSSILDASDAYAVAAAAAAAAAASSSSGMLGGANYGNPMN